MEQPRILPPTEDPEPGGWIDTGIDQVRLDQTAAGALTAALQRLSSPPQPNQHGPTGPGRGRGPGAHRPITPDGRELTPSSPPADPINHFRKAPAE
jgi:hypothetical protein